MEQYQFYIVCIVILILLLIGTIGLGLVYFFGLFETIQVSSGKPKFQFWNRKLAYVISTGHCWECSQYFTELTSILPRHVMIGVYMQLRKKTISENDSQEAQKDVYELRREFSSDFKPDKDDCKFLVGAFIEDHNGKSLINDEELRRLEEKKYRFGVLPTSDNIVYSSFPFRGVFSVPIAIKRVYPKMMQYISDHRLCAYPAMEIYDGHDIQFMFPLSQQADFLDIFDDYSENASEKALEVETETDSESDSNTSEISETSSFEKL